MNQTDKDYQSIIELFPDIAKYEKTVAGIVITDTDICERLLKIKSVSLFRSGDEVLIKYSYDPKNLFLQIFFNCSQETIDYESEQIRLRTVIKEATNLEIIEDFVKDSELSNRDKINAILYLLCGEDDIKYQKVIKVIKNCNYDLVIAGIERVLNSDAEMFDADVFTRENLILFEITTDRFYFEVINIINK